MPNFTATVRTSYKDVAGLVLSCTRSGIIEDPTNPGFVREWVNEAAGLPSQPFIRQTVTPVTYAGGRFSNPINADKGGTQPALQTSPVRAVVFDRSRSTFLQTDALAAAFPAAPSYFGIGYQFAKGADTSNSQVIGSISNGVLAVRRRDAAGDGEIEAGIGSVTTTGDHPDGTFLYTGETGDSSKLERNGAALDVGTATVTQLAAGETWRLGGDAGGNYLDGTLDSFHVWTSELSPLTQDLIWQTINEDGTDYSSDTRATMNLRVWTDATANAAIPAQYDRLNPTLGAPFRYVLASLPATPPLTRVQLSAAVDGVVVPDAVPGTDDWLTTVIEAPVAPLIEQETNWSAITDVRLRAEGHYCFAITQISTGGSIFIHFDVEVS